MHKNKNEKTFKQGRGDFERDVEGLHNTTCLLLLAHLLIKSYARSSFQT